MKSGNCSAISGMVWRTTPRCWRWVCRNDESGQSMTVRFVVQRGDLRAFRWAESESKPLDDGEVRLRVDAFALTSNNITYAALGDVMNYWQFFPTGDPATGHVPVWGFASV